MDNMSVDWSVEKMYNGEPCRLQDSYIQTAQKVATSLWSCDIIPGHQASLVEANLRNRLFQPDVRHDKKPLWLDAAGQKRKCLVFGCIYCPRATTLPYSEPKFRKSLDRYFWSTA